MIDRVLNGITKGSFYLGGLAFALIIVGYVMEVVLRYFFNAPTSFTSDFTQWFFAAMVMLCIPEVTRIKGHVIISFFLEKMSAGHRSMVERTLSLAGFLICMTAAWICFSETMRQYNTGIQTEWNFPIPKWWISAVIPYGIGLAGLHFFRIALKR
ncbi:TRAP transporter small permease [Desulfatitalea tepidiphila]|uniref:TRAP transporter small permease n=1 Tax=Desulfatitalea tepidiphila TaxID=1185843 RepID=UPI0006B5D0A2|nr:TRAP transporter small permease subunit [Desulfatitalea tepidiphila]